MDINNIYRNYGKYVKGGEGKEEKDKGRVVEDKKGERDWGYFRTFKSANPTYHPGTPMSVTRGSRSQ